MRRGVGVGGNLEAEGTVEGKSSRQVGGDQPDG